MAEYIEREAIEYPYMTMTLWGLNKDTCHAYNEGVKAVQDAIAAIPAADVAPVRHARWEIIQREGCFDWCCCSNCGEIDKRQRGIQTPYCWHCGAKMAEEKMDCVSDFWR